MRKWIGRMLASSFVSSLKMWCFNLNTETWREVSTVGEKPTATTGMSMILDTSGHMLLLHGGTGHPWGRNNNGDLIAFVLSERRWKPLQCTGDCPAAKYGQAIVLRQGHLYCFGGCRWLPDVEDFLFNSELHCLDLKSQTWSLLYDDPRNESRVMYKHGLALYENKLYVVGSSYGDLYSLTHQEKLHVFDLHTKEWKIQDTLRCLRHGYPRQRKYHGWVQWKNEVYICGGHNNRIVLRDIWKLELPSLQWTRLPTNLPVTTYFITAAITPTKCLYTFGGITDLEDRPRTNAVFRLWLAIPPLLDLALKKVLTLLPDRNAETIARLRDLGVPFNVMDKLRHVE
ncbi:kelch domain-containing protein 10-like isoform X2 [Patiria miniata]|uniref:Kelch domain-containing protein 10 n=1 Tax=Patiria miniata TaxID=46514 RepID=A0A913ZRN9_PATMI|nr:kelch domain-containing protein 10-like isoform X2 [Patiria miniata]